MRNQIPVVYTWVDDSWEGYRHARDLIAVTDHDKDPARTRDNLDILKYSLRSLAAYAPWAGPITIVTMRPQVPRWMERAHPQIRVVHHDAFMPATALPTFNSFAIVAHLHELPGLGERFLYFEDDMLLASPVSVADFVDDDGRIIVSPRPLGTPSPRILSRPDVSPWNGALARTNLLLDGAFGPARRRYTGRMPLLIDRALWREMWARFPEAFAATATPFRSAANVVPEHLYPYFALASGRARTRPMSETLRISGYFGFEDNRVMNLYGLAKLRLLRRKFLCLNDNFGPHPAPHNVRLAARFLDGLGLPACPFERTPAELEGEREAAAVAARLAARTMPTHVR